MASRLSFVDTAWLRMEDPTNLMMVTGVLTFDQPIPYERLKEVIEQRLLRFDRFRQRPVESRVPLTMPVWKDDPHFDIRSHLRRIALPAPGDKEALQRMVSDLMSTPLDYSRPLWQIHLIENYEGGCAVLGRLHHSIADGIALVGVLLSMTDDSPNPPPPPKKKRRNPLMAAIKPALNAASTARKLTGMAIHEGMETLVHPSRLLDLAKTGVSATTALGKLLFMPPDPATILKGPLGVQKSAAWSKSLPLQEVKEIGKAFGGTINDVLLTAATGAIRRYLMKHGMEVDDLNFRAIIPVNLRPIEPEPKLGNHFGVVFLALPVGIGDPQTRLLELKRRMDEIKGTPEAVVAFGILNTIGMSPDQIQDVAVNMFGSKGTVVMTNVPGPREPIYLAGQKMRGMMFWVPQSGRLGLGVSILSYAGEVRLGVAVDTGLIADPDALIDAFYEEFDQLRTFISARAEDIPEVQTEPEEPTAQEPAEEIADEIAGPDPQVADPGTFEPVEPNAHAPAEHELSPGHTHAAPSPNGTEHATEPQQRRCAATTKSGEQCRQRPLRDSEFCRIHAERAPAA